MLLHRFLAALIGIAVASADSTLPSSSCFDGLDSDSTQFTTFLALLNTTSDLCGQILKGNVTVLIPTNEAFATFNASNPNATSVGQVEPLLQYHVLQGHQPLAALSGPSTILPTLLYNSSFANVTGGQRLEASGSNGTGIITSGIEIHSKIVEGDIFFPGGFVHLIDTVLEIPLAIGQTVTDINLTDYIGLANKANVNDQISNNFFQTLYYKSDITAFAPNSPQYSANYTGWDDLSTQELLDEYLYHILNDTVLYTSQSVNGTSYRTALGTNVTVYIVDNVTYINDAKVTTPDVLIANGAVQVLDRPLNPKNTTAHPAFPASSTKPTTSPSASSSPSTSGSGLSAGAKAGIGVGVGLGALIVVAAVSWLIVTRRRKRATHQAPATEMKHDYTLYPTAELSISGMQRHELSPDHVRELEAKDSRHRQELEG